jgi:hypothetical protein
MNMERYALLTGNQETKLSSLIKLKKMNSFQLLTQIQQKKRAKNIPNKSLQILQNSQ